jgi:hypothetical protein
MSHEHIHRHIQAHPNEHRIRSKTPLLFRVQHTTHLAHDWGVDDGRQRLQVVDDDVVEQRHVVAEQLVQDEVLAWARSAAASEGENV